MTHTVSKGTALRGFIREAGETSPPRRLGTSDTSHVTRYPSAQPATSMRPSLDTPMSLMTRLVPE